MAQRIDPKIMLGLGLAVVVLLVAAGASFWSLKGLTTQTRRVEHTYQVLQEVETVTAMLKDAQAGTRGYLLSGDTIYLKPYNIAVKQLPTSLAHLRELAAESPLQAERFDSLRLLAEQEFRILKPLTVPSAAMSRSAMQTLLDTDRQTMWKVRYLYARIRATEVRLQAQRDALQKLFQRVTPIVVLVSSVLAVFMVVWLVIKIVRELNDNHRLQAELAAVNDKMSRRIGSIRELAEQVVRGDYSVKVPDGESDNLGSLATLLNRMTLTLQESFGALEKRNRELDQFAYVASHDLKAPLRGISSIVKWMEDELPGELSPQLRTYLDQLKGRAHRLEDLINGLLAYARAGRTVRPREEVDVTQLLHETAELVVPPSFHLTLAPDLPTFATDRLSLQQVFTNLLSNAVKYHPRPDGSVVVSSREQGSYYEFRVQDDGPGIAPEHHQKVFLLFQTLRDRHTAESTGIGLSIVKKIIDEQGGSIRIESQPGAGAAFIFTWPR